MQNKKVIKKNIITSFVLFIFLIVSILFGIFSGQVDGCFNFVLKFFSDSYEISPYAEIIIFKIRLPRVLVASMVGASLSLGGLVFQTILRNPLSEPYILGISGGSAVGAILGILLGLAYFPWIGILAFLGAMATLCFIINFSFGENVLSQNSIILAGVMINAFCSAIILFIISTLYDSRLHSVMIWLMGDLSSLTMANFYYILICNLPCFIIIFFMSNSMNVLLLGDETAQTMGINVKKIKIFLLVISSFMVSNTVAICGLIGFVGLLVPHILRKILGPDNRILVPTSILFGGAYMIFCDLLARVISTQGEMPSGVITALIGAPLFIFLLKKNYTLLQTK